jgi:hypothetical protein
MSKPEPQNRPKFFCPIFNFEIVENEEDKTEPRSFQTIGKNKSFARFKFLGNTTIGRIRKQDLRPTIKSLFLFDQHIAGAFYKKYEDLPVIEIYEEKEDISLVEDIILALRLFKEGDVFCKIIWAKDKLQETVINPTYEMPSTIHSRIYSLRMEEIDQISKIFEKIRQADFDKKRTLRIACDRLNRSYGKSMHDEKIIDFMIAFEALFLRETSTNSGTIIATGCSFLIGKTDNEQKEIYEFIKKTYKLRNDIVHGSEIDYSGIADTTSRLKEYLRKSILMFLEVRTKSLE